MNFLSIVILLLVLVAACFALFKLLSSRRKPHCEGCSQCEGCPGVRKQLLLLLLAFSLPAGQLFASNLLYGPWVHNVDEHGFTVLWVSEKPSLDYVEIAPDDGTPFEAMARERIYETSYGRRFFGRFHCVRVESLAPGTTYRYRLVGQTVEDDSNPYRIVYGPRRLISSKKISYSVKTLNAAADTCRFSVFNDIHFKNKRFTALAAPIDPAKTDFILLNGDIVSYAQSLDTVAKYSIQPIAAQAAKLPLFFARGNHESRGRAAYGVHSLFPTPTGEFWYSFRQGPAAFIVLDAGEDKPDSSHEYAGMADFDRYRERETRWLETALQDPSFVSAPVKICIVHIPTLATKASWYSQRWITEHWAPLLEKAGVDLMLSAHHHKWMCVEAGQDGKNYPVLVNSNMERMDVMVTADGIEVKTYDTEGQLCHRWSK